LSLSARFLLADRVSGLLRHESTVAASSIKDRDPLPRLPSSTCPEQTWPETDGPRIIALAQRNPAGQIVTLILDATTANTALFAIVAHADEREAQIREVEQLGQTLPEDLLRPTQPPGRRRPRTRVASRLRAVQRAYNIAIDRDSALKPPQPARELRSPKPMAGREIELE
jgi:hypothetical protein